MSYEWTETTRPGRPAGRPKQHSADRAGTTWRRAIGRARGRALRAAVAGGLLVRRTDRRHHAGIRLHPAAALAASAGRDAGGIRRPRRASTRAARIDSGAPVAGRRLQHLRRRSVGSQRHHQGVLRAETGRHRPGQRGDARARASASWRWAACRRPTATSRSTSACSACTRGKYAPSVPPEIVMLPGNVLYEMSSWTRSILVPLSIVQARGANRRAPAGFTLDELLLPGVSLKLPKRWGLSVLFHHLDRVFKVWEKRGSERMRAAAIREAERWILTRTRHTEGLGAIYPAMMYFIMALDALDYAAGSSRPGGGHPPFRIAADRDRRPFHLPAVRLADLGHGDLRVRDGRSRHQGRPAPDPRGGLADQQRGPAQGRLEHEAARYRALRLGLRVRQRVLPRYRRHGHGAAGADARQGVERGGAGGLRTARGQLAAGHAIGRRRLGGVRRGQQLGGAQPGAVRRPQRHARSDLPGYHGARGGVPVPARHGGARGGAARRGVSAGGAGEGWKLVRALGRELHLRIVSGHARSGGQRSAGRVGGAGAGGEVAARDPESGRRMGRIVRQLRPRPLRAGAQFPVADGVGAARAAGGGRPRVGPIPARASSTFYGYKRRTANGPKRLPRAPAFPTSST